LVSEEGECLKMKQLVSTNDQIDKWLNNMQSIMIDTLKTQI